MESCFQAFLPLTVVSLMLEIGIVTFAFWVGEEPGTGNAVAIVRISDPKGRPVFVAYPATGSAERAVRLFDRTASNSTTSVRDGPNRTS